MKRNRREKSLATRLFILFIILILPMFFIREYRLIKSKKETRIIPAGDFTQVPLDPIEDKHFTFIVLTHNDAGTIERNIQSIQSQKNGEFTIYYIDQNSNDETVKLLQKNINSSKSAQIFSCKEDHEVYEKYYEIVMGCSDREVVVHLYGSDWLAHDEVLSLLSQSYAHPDVWLTYGQYLEEWSYVKGIHDPKPKKMACKKRIQKAPWVIAPLKTFYAGLFKKLHIEAGFFLSIEDESALLNPMAELAKAHVRFIPDVLFIHREKRETHREGRRLSFMTDRFKGPVEKTFSEKVADLILFSNNSPSDLKGCLESCLTEVQGIQKVHVIYETSEAYYLAYEKLKKLYPHVHFVRPMHYGGETFKQAVSDVLCGEGNLSPYVILSSDQVRVQSSISLSSCIGAMRKAGAYGFYFHLGKEGEADPMKGIYAWNIPGGKKSIETPDALQMGLYRRLDLERDLKDLSFNSPSEMVAAWTDHAPSHRIGLSFEEARITSSLITE